MRSPCPEVLHAALAHTPNRPEPELLLWKKTQHREKGMRTERRFYTEREKVDDKQGALNPLVNRSPLAAQWEGPNPRRVWTCTANLAEISRRATSPPARPGAHHLGACAWRRLLK